MTLNPANPRKNYEWSQLVNAQVEIRQNSRTIRQGIVEDVMPDSSALWIAADGTSPRQLFEVSEGHEVWVTPQEMSGELFYRMTTKHIFE